MDDDPIGEFETWSYERKGLKRRTTLAYVRELQKLAAFRSPASIRDLTRDDIRRYYYKRNREAPGSRNKIESAVGGFYGYLVESGQRIDNPAQGFRGPPPPRRPPITPKSAGTIEDKITRLPKHSQLLARFLVEVGRSMTMDEIADLREIPPVGDTILVRNEEAGGRSIPLSDKAREYLNELGGGVFIKPRAIQRRLQLVGLTTLDLRRKRRTIMEIDLHPAFDAVLHSTVEGGHWEAAVRDGFAVLESRLKKHAGPSMQHLYGRRLIDFLFAESGPLAPAFPPPRDEDREPLRMLFSGAVGYFKNELSHEPVRYPDSMLAREVFLLVDLLMRLLDNIESWLPKP